MSETVDTSKRKYTVSKFNKEQISKGIKEIDFKYKKKIKFDDKLVCIIIKNN